MERVHSEEVYVMKVRIKFRKFGAMKFIGHLDIMRYFQKSMRRANIPIAFTQGYSPHMIMSFANPLGVGLTSEGEYFDIELIESIDSQSAIHQLNAVMVEGMEIVSFVELPDGQKTGMSIVTAADYYVLPVGCNFDETFETGLNKFAAKTHINIVKKTKKSEREVDIRPMIYKIRMDDNKIFMQVATGSVENLKPELVMDSILSYLNMDKDAFKFNYHRLEVYAKDAQSNELVSLESLGVDIL